MRSALLTFVPAFSLLAACGGTELPFEPPSARESDGVLTATVRMSGGTSSVFVPDEVVASVRGTAQARELVIFARSLDLDETLAFVIDLNAAPAHTPIDLSAHGVLYLEPSLGGGGGDLLFDGLPQGTLEVDGPLQAGESISGRFSVIVPGYDAARPGDEISATIEGSFNLQVVAPQP